METKYSEQQLMRAHQWAHKNYMESICNELRIRVKKWHPPIDCKKFVKEPPLSREIILARRKEERERKRLSRLISNELFKENALYDRCISNLNKKKKDKSDYRKLTDLKWAKNRLQAGTLDNMQNVMDAITDPRVVVPITTMYQLIKAESSLEIASVLLTFYSVFKEQIGRNVHDIIEMVTHFMNDREMQDGWLDDLDNYTLTLEGFFNATVDNLETKTFKYIKELYYFLWGVVLGIFPAGDNPTPYVASMMKEAEKTEFTPYYGLGLLRGLNYILRRGILAFKTKCPLHFFHEEAAYSKWLDEVYALEIDKANLNSPDKTRQMVPTVYVAKCERLIAQGKEISTLVSGNVKKTISAMTVKMMISKNEVLDNIHAQQMREAPFAILLNSKPKFAKSTFASILHTHFAQFTGLPSSKDSIYNRNFKDPFWSGFNSGKWCVILDDIANENPNKISSVYESSTAEVIQVINNVAYLPNMASLDEKGKTICMPRFVIGTTNTSHLNDMLFNNAYAIHRRFRYVIDLEVKPEYRDDVDDGFDPSKVTGPFPDTGDILDIWNIKVYQKEPCKSLSTEGARPRGSRLGGRPVSDEGTKLKSTKLGVKSRLLLEFDSLCPFLLWFKEAIAQHDSIQKRVMVHDVQLESTKFCLECAKIVCKCNRTVQGGNIPAYDDTDVVMSIALLFFYGYKIILELFIAFGDHTLSYVGNKVSRLIIEHVLLRALSQMRNKFLGKLGPFVKSMIVAVGALIALISTYIAAATIKQCFNPSKKDVLVAEGNSLQGAMMSSSEDKYYCNLEVSRSFDFGLKTLSWKGLSSDQVVDAIKRNVVYVRTCGLNRKFGNALFVGGNIMVTNHHLFCNYREFEIVFNCATVGSNTFHVSVTEEDVWVDEIRDLMFVRIRQMPNFKSLQELFPKSILGDLRARGMIMTRSAQGVVGISEGVSSFKGKVYCRNKSGKEYVCDSYSMKGPITKEGDCGSIYLSFASAGPVLLGIHQSFENIEGVANCCVILQSDIIMAIQKLGPMVQGGCINTEKFVLSPLSNHSSLRRIENPACSVFGSTGVRFPSKTKVEKTLIYNDVVGQGIVDLWSGPVFTRQAWINAMKPLLQKGEYVLDLKLMDSAAEMYIREVVNVAQVYDETKRLTLDQAVNGIDGVAYIDKINRSTSAGFPYCKSKKALITMDGDKAVPHDEIMDDVERLRDLYKNKERGFPIFMGTLKDEVLKKSKVALMKTRLFTGSPFAFSIILRQYFLPLVATMQNQPQLFEAYVGVNAMGPQWCDLYTFLTTFGKDRICAGDYQAFDKTMCPAIVLKAFEILIALARHAGYSELDCDIMRVMSYDVAFPLVNLDGDVVMVYGMNPSGHPLTVTINCIVNCILLRMAFIHYNPGLDFKENVHLATYGDDNIFGVKEGCNFNHTLLSTFLKTQGIIYTMADKEAASVPFITIDESTFLKRRFAYSEHHRCIVAPLDMSSIMKSLLYVIPSGALCVEEQLISQISSALIHLSLWEKSTFEKWRSFFCTMVTKYGLEPFLPKGGLFTWEVLLFKFLNEDVETEEIHEVREMQGGESDLRLFFNLFAFVTHSIPLLLVLYIMYIGGVKPDPESSLTLLVMILRPTFVVYFLNILPTLLRLNSLPLRYLYVVPLCIWGCLPVIGVFSLYLLYLLETRYNVGKRKKRFARVLQCGSLDDVEQCFRCGYDDCLYPNNLLTQCPRCKRCRFWEPVEDDVWFLGCVYCETEYPMSCDMCLSPTVDVRVRLDTLHNLFYCARCYNKRVKVTNSGKRKGNPVRKEKSPHSHDGLPVNDDLTLTRLMRVVSREANTILDRQGSDPTQKYESNSVSI